MIFVNDRKITLNQIIANKERSKTHLQQFAIPQFIKFCSSHQQIVNVIGNSRICKKTALMCNMNCQKHKRQDNKHQYVDVKEFLTIIKNMKDKYIQYHGTLLNKAIPHFIGKLKIVVLQFIQGLEKWNQQTSVVDNFLYYTRNRRILDLFTIDPSENDMSHFTCRDMCELYYISEKIKAKQEQDFEKDMFEDLKDLFHRSLVSYRLLPQPRQRQKQQEIVRGGLDEAIRKMKDLQISLEKNIKADVKSKSNLAIILTENVNIQAVQQGQEKINNALKVHLGIPPNQKPQMTLAEKQQQVNQKLVQLIQMLEQYMRKCQSQKIKLAFKISFENTEFWQFLFEKILNVIREDERKSSLNQIQIYSPHTKQISKMFSQYVAGEDEALSINLRVEEFSNKPNENQVPVPQKQTPLVKPSDGEKYIKQFLNKQNFQNYIRASFKNFLVTFF